MVGIDAFWVFMRTILKIEPYSPLKPTKVSFIFISLTPYVEPKILQLSISRRKLLQELGLKVRFKKLWLKFLNCGLWINYFLMSYQTETALMYDAVHLFAKALDELDQSQVINKLKLYPRELGGGIYFTIQTFFSIYLSQVLIDCQLDR